MAFKMFHKNAFCEREACQLLAASLISSKEDGWAQKNLHLELALNVANWLLGKKLTFTSTAAHHIIQTVDKQDTWELTGPLCLDKLG